MADTLDESSDAPASTARAHELIVGIGASAGGITALKRFFSALPADADMSYVVILHLSPDHESNLAEVLQSCTSIPVRQVRERVRIEPNHAYVVPPNKKLGMIDGYIDPSDLVGVEERRAPIDMFLRTLAESHQARAVSVILSGTGADGSMGIKRIKECGGLCIAQEPGDAEFPDMPRSAIGTALVDFILPANEIPARLAAYRRHLQVVTLPEAAEPEQRDHALVEIFTLLRLRTGHDFSNYKRSTILRRIERRMNVHELPTLAEYARFVRDNREEAQALLKDLLISVTNFFRDPEAWQALERKVIPRLFANKGPSSHVRVWVTGCATGEEAYSIAMLLCEAAPDPLNAPQMQVFATDIDEDALAKARAGLYTLNDAADVSPERLRRFFAKEGDAYRVQRELREMVLFAAHNVIKDPPFSHLDLVSCRNLMIYMNRLAQERILKLLHFGLNPGGFLMLGSSESAEEVPNLFVSFDKEAHLFQSRSVQTPLTMPPVHATPLPVPNAAARAPAAPGTAIEARVRERFSYLDLHHRLLEHYAPPSVVVNRDFDVLHLSERAGSFLQFIGGEPTQNLLKVVKPELRLELHGALYNATHNKTRAEAVAGPVPIDGRETMVRMVVSPVYDETDPSRGLILVVFENAEVASGPKVLAQPEGRASAAEPLARQLDEELIKVKAQLRATIEQYELQQEELKASNEELQAMNEELRSSSEELETSKEELQSLNEELTTVNQELKIKIDELSHANNDTRNLMNSTDIATVFVDRTMRIKLFTPRARALFNLIPGDVGRPLLDITHRLRYPEMAGDIERVLDTLATGEREVQSADGPWYIARALPYRTADDRIAGVVLTFTDITERRRVEDRLRDSDESMRLMLESVPGFAIFTMDEAGVIRTWNTGAQHMFGWTEAEALGQPAHIIFTPEDQRGREPDKELEQARTAGRALDERWHQRKDGSRLYVSGVVAPIVRGGRVVGYTKVARDLTERQRIQAEESQVQLLRALVQAQEEERSRISRELHDQLGQEITALGLKLAVIKASAALNAEARREIEGLEAMVKGLDDDVETLVWQLRPTGLDELGLPEALQDYVSHWSRLYGVRVRLDAKLAQRLAPEMETVLYRVAQEALNNVARHARAKRVSLTLESRDGAAFLVVQDDGLGFDMGEVGRTSVGLLGMRERAALVGGSASVESAPGKGTRVTVRIPLGSA